MRLAAGLLAMTVFAAAGCTMCPDPFDYSGPVPNGSAPQNDFCARSNGILPLHVAPMPWPPVVEGDAARRSHEPIPEADPDVSLTAATDADTPAEQADVNE